MHTVVKTLSIPYGSGATYLTATNISLDVDVFGVTMAFRLYLNGTTTVFATLNAAAMAILYPTATAKPFKMDHSFNIGQGLISSSPYIYVQFKGTNVQQCTGLPVLSYMLYSVTDVETSAVTNSTRSSTIRYAVHSSSIFNAVAGGDIVFNLYFYQYDCAANTISNGINSATVSNSAPYYNDSVTYTATVKPGATWQGWYSDAAHTNLVSTSLSYTTTPNSDLTLYAYAGTLATPPVITVGTPSLTAISNIAGTSVSTCTFTADQDLDSWEARAYRSTESNYGHGVGDLVESGTTLAKGTVGTVEVESTELVDGDDTYTIYVFGHTADGMWSDG